GVEILVSLGQPHDKGCTRRLARRRRRKEDLLQHCVSLQGRITAVPCQTRFLKVHDVLTAARRGPDENYPAENRAAILRHLLCDHSAERESDHVTAVHSQAVQEVQRMRRQSGYL